MYHAMACLTVPKLYYLGEHSEVSQAWSLHACAEQECCIMTGLFPRAYNATVLGTFRSNDVDGNENVK